MSTKKSTSDQGDLLLWVAGGCVAAIGLGWLLVMKPWGGGAEPVATAPVVAATASVPEEPAHAPPGALAIADPTSGPETPGVGDSTLDNPLRMAQLAYDAGMLVEPEEYSAWTLFARVLKAEPDNAVARDGLTKVADDLVKRGETALDQGRFDDARNTVERIRAVLPAHAGAKTLAAKIWPESAAKPEAVTLRPKPAEPPPVERVEVAPTPAPKPALDPLKVAAEGFDKAMAAGRLLTPVDESAKHFVGVLVSTNPTHELTDHAKATLEKEFLSRASQSIEALDAEAARIWIEEAEAINNDPSAIASARAALTDHLVAMESAKPLPASALKVVTYVAPVYPERALERGLDGWVDVEFTVGTDGTTHDVNVADASHDTYFRREAVAAVSQWTFEPRIFMNRPIEQRSYTRIRFVN